MWMTIISALAMIAFIFAARSLFEAGSGLGTGGMAEAVIGYGFVLFAGIASMFLVYKASVFGLEG